MIYAITPARFPGNNSRDVFDLRWASFFIAHWRNLDKKAVAIDPARMLSDGQVSLSGPLSPVLDKRLFCFHDT